ADNGLRFRCAVADTPGAAWALARYGEDRSLAAPGDQRAWLEPLPPAALRLEPQAAAQIERLGLRRLAQLMEIPRGPFARRFRKLFAPKLESVDRGFGIEVVTIAAFEVEPISGRQGRIDAGRDATVEEGLAPLVDRLVNRLGEGRVWRARPAESHAPELAA